MIAYHENLPLLQLPSGHEIGLEWEWVVRSLARAAAKAGYLQWWLAEHVAQSVMEYLREQKELNVITLARLEAAVCSALEVIGYPEVGQHFEAVRPRVCSSLVGLARAAGSGYELAFFELLRSQIHEVVNEQGCDFELTGLDRCVKLLKGKKVWSRDCETLRDEIILFTQVQTELAAAGQAEATCSLR